MAEFRWTDLENADPAVPDSGDDVTVEPINAMGHEVERLGTAKQDVLESGTNIKTINGDSILGSGDIEIDAPIQSISVNGDDVPPDENGNVEIEAYQKPQTGIPESDLSDGVQTKLNDDLAKRLAMYGKDVTPTANKLSFYYEPSMNAYYVYVKETDRDISGDIVIPYEYNGTNGLKPVYGVADIKNCTGITSITFPRSITTINGSYAFSGCTGLVNLEFPNSLRYLSGNDMFSGCTNLISVTLPNSISTFAANNIFNNRPANLVVYCGKGSNAESYCIDNNIPYAYITHSNDFKTINNQSILGDGNITIQDVDKRKLKLHYHFIAGYSVLTAEPSDWSTNYTNYYTLYGTSTSEDMAYLAVTGDVAPTFVSGQYYSKATGTTVSVPWLYFPEITDEATIRFSNINSGGSSTGVNFVDENGKRVNIKLTSDGIIHLKIKHGWLFGISSSGTISTPSTTNPASFGGFGTKTGGWLGEVGLRNLKIDGHIKIYTPQEVE